MTLDCAYSYAFSLRKKILKLNSHRWVRVSSFDTRSDHILSFLLPLIQEGQLSVTGQIMCTKYWLGA